MAITINSLPGVTGITTSLVAGGTLDMFATYYVTVIAKSADRYGYNFSPWDMSSKIVEESVIFIPVNSPNRTIRVNWNPVAGAVRYEVHLTRFGSILAENQTYPATGGRSVTGTTFDILSLETRSDSYNTALTSTLATAKLPYAMSKLAGTVDVVISGNESLQSIRDALVTAGFGDHIYYDWTSHFSIRGWIRILAGSTGNLGRNIGETSIEAVNLTFIIGWISNSSTSFNVTLGRLTTTPSNFTSWWCNIRAWVINVNLLNLKIYQGILRLDYGYILPNTLSIGSEVFNVNTNIVDCTFIW